MGVIAILACAEAAEHYASAAVGVAGIFMFGLFMWLILR